MKPRIKRIKKNGIYDIPAELYHSDPAPSPSLSASVAKILIGRSPMHAWYAHPKLNKAHVSEEAEQFDIGKAAHDALLEGINRIEIVRADSWRTNAAKEQRDAARAKGLIPLLEKNYDRVAVMVQIAKEAIANCEDLAGITLADGKAEQTLVWQDIGTWCRSRLDWLANDHALILDYKTTGGSAHPSDWTRSGIENMGGDVQAAFYTRGLRCVKNCDAKFVFMVQEIDPPYPVSFIGMPPSFLALGDQKVNAAIAQWADCLRADEWPAYPNRIVYPEAPAYAEAKYIERASIGSMGTDLYDHLFGRKEETL